MTCSEFDPPLCAKLFGRAGRPPKLADWLTFPIGGQPFSEPFRWRSQRPARGGAARRVPACALHRQLATKAAGMRHRRRSRVSVRNGGARVGVRGCAVTAARPRRGSGHRNIRFKYLSNAANIDDQRLAVGNCHVGSDASPRKRNRETPNARPDPAPPPHPLLRTANSATNTWPNAAAQRAVARHQRKVTSRAGTGPGRLRRHRQRSPTSPLGPPTPPNTSPTPLLASASVHQPLARPARDAGDLPRPASPRSRQWASTPSSSTTSRPSSAT
jgi:hypothetical protein